MDILSLILDGLQSYLLVLLVGAALAKLPALLGRLFGKGLDLALDKAGPELDEVILAAVRMAEKAIPEPGKGADKYAMVARLISNGLPTLKLDPDQLDDVIEKAVDAMKDEAVKRLPPEPPRP